MKKISQDFWKNKRVLITGHTGFKGSWLCLWLNKLGAKVIGYSLLPQATPNFYNLAQIDEDVTSKFEDIRNLERLKTFLYKHKPEIIFHMAAQSLVRKSYLVSIDTYEINIMGAVNLFEAARKADSVRVIINVTSDKCYDDKKLDRGYTESDALGGFDPYSCSKSCSELITNSFRNAFFTPEFNQNSGVGIATARSGNVIAGGDWSEDRLVPDIILSILNNNPILIRNPDAIRPWQYVLDSLHGYMILAENLWENSKDYSSAWNFGPCSFTDITVSELTTMILEYWNNDKTNWTLDRRKKPFENPYLRLDSTKANSQLLWKPKLDIMKAVELTVKWYKAYNDSQNMKKYSIKEIDDFENLI